MTDLQKISFTRQNEILDPETAANTHVTICGLGTVGSNAAVELARMGVGSLHLIDDDVVEDANIPSQAYRLKDIGRPKSEALAEIISEVSDFCEVRADQVRLYGGEVFEEGPVVLAVDDMDARKNILELSVADRASHNLIVDGRMAGKHFQLIAFDPSDAEAKDKWVNEHWFPQDDAVELPCGGRTVSFVGAISGGMIASYVCRGVNDNSVPFFFQTDFDHYRSLVVG